jgi:hypothetical protein
VEFPFSGIVMGLDGWKVEELVDDVSFDRVISPSYDYEIPWRSLVTHVYERPEGDK